MIATLVFSAMEMKGIKKNNWLAFIYAVPVSMVVAICFSGVWGRAADIMFTVSGFVWSLALSTFLSVKIANKWLIFIIMIPVQAIIVLSCNLGKKPLFRKNLSLRTKLRLPRKEILIPKTTREERTYDHKQKNRPNRRRNRRGVRRGLEP